MKRLVVVALTAALLVSGARAQSPEASLAQDLSNCAGAVAAFANADIMRHPEGASGVWSIVLSDILARLNREPGVEGMTGRIAANAARGYWAERPRAEQEQAATHCRARFGSQ